MVLYFFVYIYKKYWLNILQLIYLLWPAALQFCFSIINVSF